MDLPVETRSNLAGDGVDVAGREEVDEHEGVGKRTRERVSDDPVIACPWHGWEYDVETGEHIGDPRVSLGTYDVVVDDGDVYVLLTP